MEITRKPPSNGVSGYVQNVRDNKVENNRPDKAPAAEAGSDKVRLSNGAREVQEAVRILKEMPDVRTDMVAELKARVDQGTYQPDEKKIAFNLLKQSFLDEIE